MKPYRILSLDGGGVRGIFSATLTAMIDKETEFLKHVDLFAGNSIGALIALALARGVAIEELIQLYQELGAACFEKNPAYLTNRSGEPKYQTQRLYHTLIKSIFPEDLRLKDLSKKVVIPAFECSSKTGWRPVVFHNFDRSPDLDTLVIDVALRSMAAPLYFSGYQGYIDGGVFANNPSTLAHAIAKDWNKKIHEKDEITLLSIGTGIMNISLPDKLNWGVNQWLNDQAMPEYPLFSLVTEGTGCLNDLICKSLLKDSYNRVNETFERFIPLDDVTALPYLLDKALKFPLTNPEKWGSLIRWIYEKFLR